MMRAIRSTSNEGLSEWVRGSKSCPNLVGPADGLVRADGPAGSGKQIPAESCAHPVALVGAHLLRNGESGDRTPSLVFIERTCCRRPNEIRRRWPNCAYKEEPYYLPRMGTVRGPAAVLKAARSAAAPCRRTVPAAASRDRTARPGRAARPARGPRRKAYAPSSAQSFICIILLPHGRHAMLCYAMRAAPHTCTRITLVPVLFF